MTGIDVPTDKDSGKYKIHYSRYAEGSKKGIKESDEFDLIIGSDGANSRVAKVICIHERAGGNNMRDRFSYFMLFQINRRMSECFKCNFALFSLTDCVLPLLFPLISNRQWTLGSTTSP